MLIVDDEPAIRRLLTGALGRSAITHVEAANAAEALRLAAAQPAPLVALLDLGLPDRDGLKIVPQLAKLGLAVLVLTAHDATEEKVAALDLGADDFITKPFDSEELLARVRSALRRMAGPRADTTERAFAGGTIERETHAVTVRTSLRASSTSYGPLPTKRAVSSRMRPCWKPSGAPPIVRTSTTSAWRSAPCAERWRSTRAIRGS